MRSLKKFSGGWMKVIRLEDFGPEFELERNRKLALENRKILDEKGVKAIDVMGSVGSGKTSIIVEVSKIIGVKVGAIAGDLETTIDADRMREAGIESIEINTGKECHLDSNLVKRALSEMKLEGIKLLFIENVGNLICPAEFPLGAHKRILVLSITEGPYIVKKHPFVFLEPDLVIINKIDLSRAIGLSPEDIEEDIRRMRDIPVIKTSVRTGEGIPELSSWIKREVFGA